MQHAQAAILRHMPYFLAVVEEGSVQAAAARMNVAQSALSRRIRLLEQELGGIPLFERTHRGMRLLPVGEALLDEARAVLIAIERARLRVAALARGATGRLAAGFVELVTRQPDMLEAIQAFARDYPTVELKLKPLLSEEQRTELSSGVLDVALLYHDPREAIAEVLSGPGVELRAAPLMRDPFVVAVPCDHALARRPRVRLAEFADDPVIWASHRKTPRLYDRLIEVCERQGYTPRIIMETPTSDVTMKVVAAGMAIGFVPASLIDHAPPKVAFVRPADLDFDVQLSLVWNTRASGGLADRLAEYLLRRMGGEGFESLDTRHSVKALSAAAPRS
jgi:DNA-binding transcriptional LysR family regulator